MKLKEIIEKIDRETQNEEEVDTVNLGEMFGLNLGWVVQERLKSYWVSKWICTDTWVGQKVYF